MTGWEVEYLEKIERAHGTKSFRFEKPRTLTYLPGQYFFLTIPKPEGEEGVLMHHFTFSDSPRAPFVEFTTRVRESEFKQRMDSLEPGTKVRITQIHGEFTIKGHMKKVVFLAGGIGITAARSNIRYALEVNTPVDIVLLHQNKDEAATAFKKEFHNLSTEHDNFNAYYMMSRPEKTWSGAKGHISSAFIKSKVPDQNERFFFISGPPAYNEAMKKVLAEEVGVSEERIITENFLGY